MRGVGWRVGVEVTVKFRGKCWTESARNDGGWERSKAASRPQPGSRSAATRHAKLDLLLVAEPATRRCGDAGWGWRIAYV